MNTKHFVLTRFNIPFSKKDGMSFLYDEQYLQKRFNTFYQYCFQSLKAQTCQNFIWLVFFDVRTPKTFKDRNAELQKEMPNYQPYYIDIQELSRGSYDSYYLKEAFIYINKEGYQKNVLSVEDIGYEDHISRIVLPNYWNNIIRKYLDESISYVITSRIDNDDCFEQTYVANVQENCNKSNVGKVINFDNGLQYIKGKNIVQHFFYPNNHFTSLMESVENPLHTILYWEHFFIDRQLEVVHLNKKPLWMEILHDSNAINTIKMGKGNRLKWNVNLESFGLAIQWGTLTTIRSIIVHPLLYLYPWIKHVFHLTEIKQCLLKNISI